MINMRTERTNGYKKREKIAEIAEMAGIAEIAEGEQKINQMREMMVKHTHQIAINKRGIAGHLLQNVIPRQAIQILGTNRTEITGKTRMGQVLNETLSIKIRGKTKGDVLGTGITEIILRGTIEIPHQGSKYV